MVLHEVEDGVAYSTSVRSICTFMFAIILTTLQYNFRAMTSIIPRPWGWGGGGGGGGEVAVTHHSCRFVFGTSIHLPLHCELGGGGGGEEGGTFYTSYSDTDICICDAVSTCKVRKRLSKLFQLFAFTQA